MSKKFSFIFSILVFAILFSFIGCTDLLAPKAQTDINLKIDLSKIIKSSRNEGGSQGASSLGDNPTIKVAIYDAKDYDKATNSTENLTLITQAQASVGGDGIARVKLSDIPVGIDAIVFGELSFTNENSTQVVYAGNSGVFKVKASDNKVSLVLMKVGNSEIYPDDTNTPYENYTLYKKTENGEEEEVSNNTEASISTSSTMETNVTINPDNSDSVWTYFVKPNDNERFKEKGNYRVSVDLKAGGNETTVVGIAAARADYFFTVNSDWTTCEFNTGYLIGNEEHQFTIGLGLSSEIQIKNLKIEKLSEIDTTEPSLVFDISKDAIETYLEKADKATKIIDVEKVEDDSGMATAYNITINAPLTNNDSVQNVKLHLRDYAKSVGVNNVSFEVKNTGEYPFATSFMADTASNNSKAWNNVRTEVVYSNYDSCNIDFPNYTANDELTVDVITGSSVAYPNYPVKFTISKFKVEEPVATSTPFANKFFAIQVGENWTQRKSVEVAIPAKNKKEFDVGMFNGWVSSKNMPSSFDDVTRFFYTGDTNIADNLIYSVNNDDPNKPKFIITNDSGEDKIVKISLNENYEVVIEDVSSIVTTWADLKYRIDNTSISEIVIKNDLIATERIYIGRRIVKIIADRNVIIFRAAEGEFFHIYDGAGLELGCEEYSITLDGKNDTVKNKGPLIWQYQQGLGVTLTNCILQNNTLSNDYEQYERGAAIKTEQLFTMNNCSISNCHGSNGGAVYTFHNGSFTMNGGSIKNCTATENGNAVYIGSGNLTLSGDAEITSDVYLTSGTTVKVAGNLTGTTPVATITPSEYTEGTQVLTAENDELLLQSVDKFILTTSADGTAYEIDSYGKLASVSQNYAQGLTCDVGSDGTVTLYISSAKGLATFRDIVNGSLTKDIFVIYDSNENSNNKFEAYTSYPSVNGTLRDSITISGEWTPIGVYSNITTSAKPYSGTFDGGGMTVTFNNITHSDTSMYSSGLFQMVSGSVKNLVIDGSISRTQTGYIGGITGYLNGGTIENCVNKATITNSATNGTGGIVGYVANSTATIKNCVNMAKVESTQSTVGGIVGNVGNLSVNSNLTISKCINLGKISGASNISGILGNANTSAISISDCMNLGEISANNTSGPAYASGITTPSAAYTVSSCINVGQVSATSGTSPKSGAISSIPTNGTYTNNYYDSTVNSSEDESSTPGITRKSTTELIGSSSNLSLQGITTDNWTFADNRYPLPDIAENIPDDENDEIWNAVLEAAIPDSSSTSGGVTYRIGDVYYQNNTPMGVVFEVAADNSYIKIVALEESSNLMFAKSGWLEIKDADYFSCEDNGLANYYGLEDVIVSNENFGCSLSEFPAADFCYNHYEISLDELWYLPAINELISILQTNFDMINTAIESVEGTTMKNNYGYWSSTMIENTTKAYYCTNTTSDKQSKDVTSGCNVRPITTIEFSE